MKFLIIMLILTLSLHLVAEEQYKLVCDTKSGKAAITFIANKHMLELLHKKLLEKYPEEYKYCVLRPIEK